jgi:prepilin-type N-terminal cleavage/methylation domain-containing protein
LTNAATPATPAFTLIELLVVIAIIGILAGLMLPVGARIKQTAQRKKAQAELEQVAFAIETYKDKLGHYPPDTPPPPANPNWPRINPLYFELMGTKLVNNGTEFETLDGAARIAVGSVAATFGSGVSGFVNCTRAANADDAPEARSFLSQLKPTQYGETTPGSGIRLLVCSVRWPEKHDFQPIPAQAGLNPWRYISSNPTNNPGSYDLWVDILVGGKTNRISNWSKQPQIVNRVF